MNSEEQKEMTFELLRTAIQSLEAGNIPLSSLKIALRSLEVLFNQKTENEIKNIVSKEALKQYCINWFEKNGYLTINSFNPDKANITHIDLINNLFNSISLENFENIHLGIK